MSGGCWPCTASARQPRDHPLPLSLPTLSKCPQSDVPVAAPADGGGPGQAPTRLAQPHLPGGRGTCRPGHGSSCKGQEGKVSGSGTPKPPPHPLAPTAPNRCWCSAASPQPPHIPRAPGPAPHSLSPQVGRLLDIVLHPARQSTGGCRGEILGGEGRHPLRAVGEGPAEVPWCLCHKGRETCPRPAPPGPC